VATRALALPPEWWATTRTLEESNAAWRAAAEQLAEAALRDALARRSPAEVDLVAVTTVTGTATPGIDVALALRLGLRPDVARLHLNNLGCHAALPLLRAATDHVRARPGSLAAAVAVEVCSACFQADDDPENLVALSLFADGAAAALVANEGDGPEIVDFASRSDFGAADALGFDLGAKGFRIRLAAEVPARVGEALPPAVDGLLARHGLRRSDVTRWCLHPGGSRVLDVARDALGLDERAIRSSRRVLRGHGNLSSPTVLFVLAESLVEDQARPGDLGVLAAFGPGLGVEVALLRW
jgi:alkylresorcinol/alkylpyrone synthase